MTRGHKPEANYLRPILIYKADENEEAAGKGNHKLEEKQLYV